MNLSLKRFEFGEQGIFSKLYDDAGHQIGTCLEHAYPDDKNSNWIPKVPAGVYSCQRHPPVRLPYETFMVTGVPNFQGAAVTGILFHRGNFDKDSEGCILVGEAKAEAGGTEMVTNSKFSFDLFMDHQVGVDSFQLVII